MSTFGESSPFNTQEIFGQVGMVHPRIILEIERTSKSKTQYEEELGDLKETIEQKLNGKEITVTKTKTL